MPLHPTFFSELFLCAHARGLLVCVVVEGGGERRAGAGSEVRGPSTSSLTV